MRLRWYHVLLFVVVVLVVAVLSVPSERELGLLSAQSGNVEKAQRRLRRAVQQNPADREALKRLVDLAFREGQPGKVVAPLEAYLIRAPKDAEMRRRLVEAKVRTGDLEGAISVARHGDLSPEDRERLADLYESAGHVEQAEEVLAAMLDGSGEDAARLERIARLERWRTNPEGEAKVLEDLARVRPTAETWGRLMDIYTWLGDIQKAAAAADGLENTPGVQAEDLRAIRTVRIRGRDSAAALRAAERVCAADDAESYDWLVLAQLHVWSGSPAKALAALDQAIQKHPRDVEVLRLAATLNHKTARYDAAAALAARVAEVTGDEADWRAAAQNSADAGRPEEGVRLLARYRDVERSSPWTFGLAGRLALRVGDRDEALGRGRDLAARAVKHPDESDTASMSLELLLALGAKAEALGMFEALAAARTDEVGILLPLAQLYVDLGRRDAARQALARLEKAPGVESQVPPQDRVWLNLALGRVREAVELLRRMDNAPSSLWLEAADHLATPEGRQALLEALDTLEKDPGLSAADLRRLASVCQNAAIYDRAARLYERSLAKAPDDPAVMLALGDAYGRLGDVRNQDRIMEDRAARVLKTEQAWLDWADRRQWANDRQGEEAVLARAQQQFPASTVIARRRLVALAALGRDREASDLYQQQAAAVSDDDPASLRAGAAVLANLGRRREAADFYRRALKVSPNDPEALVGLARVLAAEGDLSAAEGLYRQYLGASPGDGWAWYELGDVIERRGGSGRAEQDRALLLLPLDGRPETFALHARVRARQGRGQDARRLYEKALAARAGDPDLTCDYLDLLLQAKDYNEAEAVLRRAEKAWPKHARVRRLRAGALLARGQNEEARAVLRKLFAENPNDAGIEADLAFAEEACGNWSAAVKHYESAAKRLRGQAPAKGKAPEDVDRRGRNLTDRMSPAGGRSVLPR